MNSSDLLSTSELKHLALHATHKGQHENAITQLRRLLVSQPDDAEALYLLGALHADIGMYTEAKIEISKALDINPEMTTARFQLGLLHFSSGDAVAAESTWQALDSLDDRHSLKLFKKGLVALASDDFDACKLLLQKGIELNQENENLNNDMRLIISEIDRLRTTSSGVDIAPTKSSGQLHFLSAYDQQNNED